MMTNSLYDKAVKYYERGFTAEEAIADMEKRRNKYEEMLAKLPEELQKHAKLPIVDCFGFHKTCPKCSMIVKLLNEMKNAENPK